MEKMWNMILSRRMNEKKTKQSIKNGIVRISAGTMPSVLTFIQLGINLFAQRIYVGRIRKILAGNQIVLDDLKAL